MNKNLMELGRSMVEMLGVLAVIGLLSIIGVSGYKKAMLHHYANEAWDSMMKFQAIVKERVVLYPKEKCNGTSTTTWYCSAKKGESGVASGSAYCYLDRKDLLPDFANGSYANYYNFIDPPMGIAQWRNISIDNLCTTLLPESKLTTPASGTPYYSQKIGDIEYRCFRKSGSVAW